ncbi:bifunctional DNA-binding transcriptional regulator/O6-methylguanine-DNA methyltransferase Ada [Rhodomicrobium vannielii ATCC 17100]|uniref:bifunctional DNA-binding transcriptional regulator/O6-methylguanine-DNA methyltransferase Ada n=1 Tax=Rhodomicrobium vannielii TaxID=1069 RepID=UPI00191A17C3|nr:bifunctional DNA-binding transcriptional regulator/O6-methylguanine-DNA methyltransferase Ada [Rhodomicrobium vannielii]MBJ7534045.1 bifunctional DNA-binding transcriptional regulator/O6-methylguanine-DNA methyltransferase Ada [Rhodomicrobium vannielii ATCC 17100]
MTLAARPAFDRDLWESDCWARLEQREADADRAFVYGVVSTGVYCRPGCPSRLPRRENVRFFADAAEARRAGFRACLRCDPDGASRAEREAALVAKAVALIEGAEGRPDFDAIARSCDMSRHHFHRMFKAATSMTPGSYFAAIKKRRALDSLGQGESVTTAIASAGYGSPSRFYEGVADLGARPRALSRGGAGEHIRFAVAACSLGFVLVAATQKGICAIELGDDADALATDFRRRFARACLAEDAAFSQAVADVVALVEEPSRAFALPLDVRGTVFQERIWRLLREIPPGETMTYGELAAKAGCPSAVRAVARACASNAIAVAIPCHRVVGKGGALTGYRWGVERKAALLKREGR